MAPPGNKRCLGPAAAPGHHTLRNTTNSGVEPAEAALVTTAAGGARIGWRGKIRPAAIGHQAPPE
jgi:hypothetical protein